MPLTTFLRRIPSKIFKRLFGADAHAWLYGVARRYTTGGWRQLRRYRKTPVNADQHKLAICAIMKNEAPYLVEWIEFHRAVGVDKFYLYANNCSDNSEQILRPYIDSGLVDYIVFDGEMMQIPAYQDCLDSHHADAEWMALIDLDEFLVPVKNASVKEVLDALPADCDQLLVNWLFFGSNGMERKLPGMVIERFTKRGDFSGLDWQTKSIVRPRQVSEVLVHCHYVKGRTIRMSESELRLHHYFCKSWEEYSGRSPRGDVFWGGEKGSRKYSRQLFDERDLNDIEDLSALRFLPKMCV